MNGNDLIPTPSVIDGIVGLALGLAFIAGGLSASAKPDEAP